MIPSIINDDKVIIFFIQTPKKPSKFTGALFLYSIFSAISPVGGRRPSASEAKMFL